MKTKLEPGAQRKEDAYLRLLVQDNPPGKIVGISTAAIGRLLDARDEAAAEAKKHSGHTSLPKRTADLCEEAEAVMKALESYSLPENVRYRINRLDLATRSARRALGS